jgi:tetratricopeptide (TPR) repeat protein
MPEAMHLLEGSPPPKKLWNSTALSEAHRALAFAEFWGNWDFVDAEKEFQRAIELNPRDPVARRWYANSFAMPGRFEQCLELMNKAQELGPSSSATLADKGVMLFNAGRTREGIDLLMEVERSNPGFRSPHYYMMLIRLYLRDYPAYLTEGQKAAEISHDAVLRDTITEAQRGYARDGARGLLNNLYTSQKKYYAAGKLSGAMLAKTCVMLGKKQEALQILEESYARHDPYLLICLVHGTC